MTYNPSGRIKRIQGGILMPPGSCVVCGGVSSDTYADLDQSIDWFGNLYMCKGCVLSASEVWEDLIPSNEEALRGHIEAMRQTIEGLRTEVAQKEALNESYRSVLDNYRSSRSGGAPVVVESLDTAELAPTVNTEPTFEPGELYDGLPESNDSDTVVGDNTDEGDLQDALDRASSALAESAGVTDNSPSVEGTLAGAGSGRLFGE